MLYFTSPYDITLGRIIDVGGSHFTVASNHVTCFAIPGDSGKLVLDVDSGDLLGMVTQTEIMNIDGGPRAGTYCAQVKPLWEFYWWLLDAVDFLDQL